MEVSDIFSNFANVKNNPQWRQRRWFLTQIQTVGREVPRVATICVDNSDGRLVFKPPDQKFGGFCIIGKIFSRLLLFRF